ncbi:DUF4190 domain-containing protein [Leifsonia sp. AG29]|uniref:DUF4190 domain-containing protein n=1 Tax=Leifsonia sp. AG29 TaxID=2598860 RepID=UPI00131C59C5|nr:DUF4190 domain-containing protein [Leifsonia sp. AG29]
MAVIAFAGSFVVALLGIIGGHIALAQIERTGEKGRGLALAGTIIGYVGAAFWVLYFAFIAVLFAVGGISAWRAADAPTDTPTSSAVAGPSAADCATITTATTKLSSALSAIESSRIADDPAGAKVAVNSAIEQFQGDTANVDLTGDLYWDVFDLDNDLDHIATALVDYQALPDGQKSLGTVDAAFSTATQGIDKVVSLCR